MKMILAQLNFFADSIYNLAFPDKKKIKFQKFCPLGFLWPQIFNKILRFCSWYGIWDLINFEQNVLDT